MCELEDETSSRMSCPVLSVADMEEEQTEGAAALSQLHTSLMDSRLEHRADTDQSEADKTTSLLRLASLVIG